MSEPAQNARSPGAGDDDAADSVVLVARLNMRDDGFRHLRRNGVQLLRAIERDDGNLAVDLEQHVLVHGGSYLSPPLRRLA